MVTENELEQLLKEGKVEEVKTASDLIPQEEDLATLGETLEDYLPMLRKLRVVKRDTSTAPTATPTDFIGQFVFYVSGTTYRLYAFIKDTWQKIFDTAGLAPAVHGITHTNGTDNIEDATLIVRGAMNTTVQSFAGVKTFGSFPITPSSAPTTDYQVANKKYVDDKSLAVGASVQTLVDNTVYQAATAGVVQGYITVAGAGVQDSVSFYTDASNPPTTLVSAGDASGGALSQRIPFSYIIKKNDYYKAVIGDSATFSLKFYPLTIA